jgi:hypothetical protein
VRVGPADSVSRRGPAARQENRIRMGPVIVASPRAGNGRRARTFSHAAGPKTSVGSANPRSS